MENMGKALLTVAETVSYEKGIDKSVIIDAIKAALASAARKRSHADIDVRVDFDMEHGTYSLFRRWLVVDDEKHEDDDEEPFNPEAQIHLTEAKAKDANLELGDYIEEALPEIQFGRIDAQAAKQAIVTTVRQEERRKICEEYESRVGELLTGTVKKIVQDGFIIDLGNSGEALLARTEVLPRESFRINDRVRAYLMKVEPAPRGPQLFLSRSHPQMLVELFRIEVPEISEEVIDIMAAARDPGLRAKIAVKTNDGRIDPVGACVGMRGSRVQAVSGELAGERVDIILWDDNPAQLVINAMAPAEVKSIVMDEDKHVMDIAVAADQLSQAIGRSGQNVRLAGELTGWELNVMSEEDLSKKGEAESASLTELFVDSLDVDEELAQVLIEEGFSSIEAVAYVPEEEMLAIEGFDDEIVSLLLKRANDALLKKMLSGDSDGAKPPADDLLTMEGMNDELAHRLASNGIVTMEDLAECAVDELVEMVGLGEEEAGKLIMKAREPWFANEG